MTMYLVGIRRPVKTVGEVVRGKRFKWNMDD